MGDLLERESAALETRHGFARDLMKGYEQGLAYAIERYGR